MLRNIILEFNMAKENKFFKTMSDISGAVSNVASIIGNVKSTKEERTAEKQASPSDLKESSVEVIDTVDKLEEWIIVAQTDASKPAAMVLQQQLQVLKYVESPAMSGMVIDNIIVCLYKALEIAESEMEKNAVRESVSALLQSILFMSEAKLQYDIKKNKEEAIEMISNAGNLISDSVTAVASMLDPLPGAKKKAVIPVVKNILSTQTIQSGFLLWRKLFFIKRIRIKRLLKSAMVDGAITEKEKQAVIKKAMKSGLSKEEAEIYTEEMIYKLKRKR